MNNPFKIGSIKARIVEVLIAHPEGIDIIALRRELGLTSDDQQHFDRRVRELDQYFDMDRSQSGVHTLYRLIGPRNIPLDTIPISKTDRARIIYRDGSSCKMCGRTVAEDHVRLHIDHRIPREWGGATEDDNLWALCSECNEGKKNFFASITDSDVQAAMVHQSVHVRIGELLKHKYGQEVPKNLLQIVANTHDDWEKRLRELRDLGWRYRYIRRKENGRVRVWFVLDHWEPWPDNPAHAIREAEKLKKTNR